MSSPEKGYNINQTFIIETNEGDGVLSACTGFYTTNIYACTGNTQILLGSTSISTVGDLFVGGDLSATTISATTFYGDGSNLTGISTQDTFITGGTYSNGVATFTNNTGGTFSVTGFSTGYTLTSSAITNTLGYVPLSSYTDTFVTGGTYLTSASTLTFTNNTGGTFSITGITTSTAFTGGTVTGATNFTGGLITTTISATTYQNLPTDIRVTGGTYSDGTATFTNNTGGTFNINGFYTGATDVFVTGATYNQNTFTFTNNTGSTFDVTFDVVTGLTVNGGLTATTLHGDGSNISGINFSQLATTAHTHSISDVINLQTNLDGKIDKPASPFLGEYLYYNGITWVPNQVNIPVAAGAGVTLFLSITGSSLPTYEYLSQFPIELTESQEPVTVNNSQVLIGKYATEQLNRTVVDQGIWEFNTYASVDIPSTGLTQIIVTAYLLSTGGSETFLFSSATENITTTAATIYTMSVVEPQYSCTTTDYLVINYSASTTNNFNTVVTLYHGGNINYSHIHTPFVTLHNDLAGLQGGFSNEYYHLSKNEVDLLTTSVDASSIHNHDSSYLSLGGGVVNGNTTIIGSLSANTYLGLPITQDKFVTGFTYNNNTFTISDNSGNTFNSTINSVTGLTITGNLTVNSDLNANTISATTYQNLPIDIFVTGATYNNANQFSFTNNTGGTFNVLFNQVTGLTATTLSATTYQNLPTDIRVTGGTYSNGIAVFTNNTGGTFNVSGFYTGATDIFVTGATYNNTNQFTFTNNTGGTFNVSFNQVTGLTANTISATTYQNLPTDVRVTGGTYSNGTATFTNNTGGTFNVSGFYTGFSGGTVTGLTANTISATTYQNLPTDIRVTGGTYSNGIAVFTNNTGGTFNVSGFYTGFSGGTVTGLTATTLSATTISGGTLYGDGTNLTGTNTIVSNTVFVSKLGNDSTGSRTNMGKPFLTLEAALTAATSGDLIVVFPGSYTATTTSVNGLAKDGISWYFNQGVTVTKTNSGDMFNTSGFTTGFNVYGQADFVRTTTTGYILNGGSSATFSTPFNIIFECKNITQSTAGGTFAFRLWDGTNNYTGTFRLNNVTNTASNIFNLDDRGLIDITANYLKCTAGNVFYQYNGNMFVNIKANIIQSTSTYAIRGNYYSYMNVSCNQLLGIGNTYYAIFIDDRYDVTLNFDYCSGIQHNGWNCIANGHIGRLLCTNTGANFKGGVCDNINISPTSVAGNIGGTVETTYNGDGGGTLTMTHGNAIITMSNSTYGGFRGLNITGGVLRLIGNSIGISTWSSNLINGGTVYFDGYCKYANTEYVSYGSGELFTLQSGKLIISGRMEQSLTGRTASVLYQNAVPTCVLWSGGTLVVNGGTLITNNVENPPIVAISSGTTNLQVLSGGLNTNFTGGTLTAKKYKAKYTVTAVASTSIALNDGSGATETFTETNTAVYNTRALLAQRMAALINASATLDITATQDTPGTDVYFYIESDFAGVPVTRTTLTNLTELVLRLNAYAMTNSTGGIIIENSIIT